MVLCLKARESRSLPGLQNAKLNNLSITIIIPPNRGKTSGPPSKRPFVVLEYEISDALPFQNGASLTGILLTQKPAVATQDGRRRRRPRGRLRYFCRRQKIGVP